MKHFTSFIALAILSLPILINAQNNSPSSPVALKTGVWQGKCTHYDSALKFNVESVSGRHIKAQINFINQHNTIVELSGEIVESFGDFVEQSHWQFAAEDKKLKDGTWIKFTEVKVIQGHWDVKQVYYTFLSGDSMVGCMFYGTDTVPRGKFELRAPTD